MSDADEVISKHMIRRTLEESGVMKTKLNTKIVYLEMSPTERKMHDIYMENDDNNLIGNITSASVLCSTGMNTKNSSTKVCVLKCNGKCNDLCFY